MRAILGVLAVACSAKDGPTSADSGAERVEGLALALRTPAGGPELDARVFVGGSFNATPDGAGFVFYLDLVPGRAPVVARSEGAALGYSAPTALSGALSASAVTLVPLAVASVADPSAEVSVGDASVAVTIPAGALRVDGATPVGALELGWAVLGAGERWGMPADLQVVTNDVEVAPFVAEVVGVNRGWQGDLDVGLAADATATVVVPLPVGSPLLAPGAAGSVYAYSSQQTFWKRIGGATIDGDARTATFATTGLGWWALGAARVGGSCVTGRVVGRDGPVLGAEVALAEDGTIGVDRRSVGADGFCLPISAGARADLRILGFDTGRAALYAWTGEVVGGAAASCDAPSECVDLGVVRPTAFLDEDEDLSWAGLGGDCDDHDAAVSPNPVTGDGSYCGGSLW